MSEWQKRIQMMADEIDRCIVNQNDEELTLKCLARRFGYSEFYISGKSGFCDESL